MQSAHIHQFARRSVRLGRIESQAALESDYPSNCLSQLADGYILTRADIDERWVIGTEQGRESDFIKVHEETTRVGEIIGVKQFTQGRSGAPHDNLRRTVRLRFGRLPDKRRQH